jgi:actin-related protein
MDERAKKRIMGNRLYSIYRRMRYLRYLRRVRKQRRKELQYDEAVQPAARRATSQKKEARLQRRRLKKEEKKERLAHKAAMKAQRKQEKIREKRKKQLEKEERLQLRREAKEAMKIKSSEGKALEKQKAQQLKVETSLQRQEMKSRLKDKARQDRALAREQKNQQKAARKIRKARIRKLRPYLFRRRVRETLWALRSIDRHTLKRLFLWTVRLFENKTERNQFFKITLNSMSLFVLAYLVLYIAGEWITLYAAQTFEYKTIVFYYKIYYNIDSDQWTADAVKILFSIKPLTGLVLGTVALIIFSSIRNDNQVFKLFFLWLFIHGMVMFFGSLLIGTLLSQGFGWVISYLYYKDTGKMVFSIISIFALVVTGTAVARSFLISGNAYFNYINRDNRKFLLLSQVLLPAVLGTVITSLMKVPNDFYFTTSEEVMYEIFKLSSIVIVIIPTILTFSSLSAVYFDEEPRNVRFHWPYILVFLGIYFAYRFTLMHGMEFGV